jgi:hypothetical protein
MVEGTEADGRLVRGGGRRRRCAGSSSSQTRPVRLGARPAAAPRDLFEHRGLVRQAPDATGAEGPSRPVPRAGVRLRALERQPDRSRTTPGRCSMRSPTARTSSTW